MPESIPPVQWSRKAPATPGFYWYKHHDAKKLEDGSNEAEPVRLMDDGRVLFLGDWRGHYLSALTDAWWGPRIEVPA